MYSLIEMMFYCIMGSQITIAVSENEHWTLIAHFLKANLPLFQDERLCSFIYASNWYKYDIRSQKILALLLHRAQQPGELLLGPIGPLTVATGVEVNFWTLYKAHKSCPHIRRTTLFQVIKGIYSYYTFLTKVL